MKILRVGDPHVKITNIEEMQKVLDWVYETAITNKVDHIEILGDLMHTHAVKRVEVEHFWFENLKKLTTVCPVICLVGNHDLPGAREKESQMNAIELMALIPNVTIVDKPLNKVMSNGQIISYMPYMSDINHFVDASKKLFMEGSTELLVTHQTFTGATYDNGFYCEVAIDPADIPHKQIISGHIHTSQVIGKCFYTGTPKWDTMSDANQNKGIWLYEYDNAGNCIKIDFLSAQNIATPIYKFVINENDQLPELIKGARNYLEFRGTTAWIAQMKKKFKGHAAIKAVPIDRKILISNDNSLFTLENYLKDCFLLTNGVESNEILSYLKELQ
jgi:DNA repair exonuclease SbcCD nuclease subunit